MESGPNAITTVSSSDLFEDIVTEEVQLMRDRL